MRKTTWKRWLQGLTAGMLLCLAVSPADAADKKTKSGDGDYHQLAPGLTWGGSLRLRGELRDDFRFDESRPANDEAFLLTQLRLHLKWDPVPWFTFFVEGQDARMIGEDDIEDREANPSIWSDDMDLHQAYVIFRGDPDYAPPLSLKLGRQKLNFGKQRLVGAFEWSNTARVFDALRFTMGNPKERTLDLLISRAVAVDPEDFNDWSPSASAGADSDFHSIYFSDKILIPNTTLDLYWMLRHEADRKDEVHTLGARFDTKIAAWDFNGELAGQWGEFRDMDHGAWAAHLEGGYTWKDFYNLRLGLAYSYASGDGDAGDNDHHTFDNLYPTNHLYYGYMDFFSWRNLHNLEMALSFQVFEKLGLRVAYQAFWLDEEDTDSWYNAGGGANRTAAGGVDAWVGSEIDLTAKYPIRKNLSLLVGYSHFFTGDYVDDTGRDEDADFGYLMIKWTF